MTARSAAAERMELHEGEGGPVRKAKAILREIEARAEEYYSLRAEETRPLCRALRIAVAALRDLETAGENMDGHDCCPECWIASPPPRLHADDCVLGNALREIAALVDLDDEP